MSEAKEQIPEYVILVNTTPVSYVTEWENGKGFKLAGDKGEAETFKFNEIELVVAIIRDLIQDVNLEIVPVEDVL